MKTLATLSIAAALSGCASMSIAPVGPDTFLVSRQGATGFVGIGDLQAEALQDAGAHCAALGRTMDMISTSQNSGPYILGNFPRVSVHFKCLKT